MKTSGSLEVSHLRTLGKEWSLQAVHRITSRHNVPKWEIFPHVSLSLKLPMRTSALQKMHAEIMRWVHSLTKTKTKCFVWCFRCAWFRCGLPSSLCKVPSWWFFFDAAFGSRNRFRRGLPQWQASEVRPIHPKPSWLPLQRERTMSPIRQHGDSFFTKPAGRAGLVSCLKDESWGTEICLRCLRFTSMAALLTFQDQRKDWNFQTWRNVLIIWTKNWWESASWEAQRRRTRRLFFLSIKTQFKTLRDIFFQYIFNFTSLFQLNLQVCPVGGWFLRESGGLAAGLPSGHP